MPGFVTVNVLHRRPYELAVRAMLAFGIALWLSASLGPVLLDALLKFYEHFIHLLDDHYRINLALTHQTGHDKVGSDLVLLGQATVMRTFVAFGLGKSILLEPGNRLACSTATGLLMQPATMILGLLLGWPLHSAREVLLRGALGSMLLALWICLGIPLSLWIFFQDIPFQAYMPNEVSFLTTVCKLLMNNGGPILGALTAFCIIAAAGRWSASSRSSSA